jgi:predicted nuclease with RNAse H fold
MTLKRGRPATGRKESYYEPKVENFERHMNNIKMDRLIKAYDNLHILAFDKPMSWSQKRDFRIVNKKGIK